MEDLGIGIEGELESVGCERANIRWDGPAELSSRASDAAGNDRTGAQSSWCGTLEQGDGDSLIVVGCGWLPGDIQSRAGSDLLILGWDGNGIETSGLSIGRGSKGADGGDGRETHGEDYEEEMLKSVGYLRYKERD